MALNLTLRSTKGSPLTAAEVDANFSTINDNLQHALEIAGVVSVNGRQGVITINASDISNALGYVPAISGGTTVTSFNNRTGSVNLTSLDVTNALGYTPATTGTQAAGSVGQVAYFPTEAAPSGWLIADGSAVSRTTYALLFALIGTTYGAGDGSTTFNLPDLRGEFVRGLDLGRGVDVGRTLGSYQAASVGSHAHGFQHVSPHANGLIWATGDDPGGNDGSVISVAGSTETRPRNVALLPCICWQPMATGATGATGEPGPQGPAGPAGTISTTLGAIGTYMYLEATKTGTSSSDSATPFTSGWSWSATNPGGTWSWSGMVRNSGMEYTQLGDTQVPSGFYTVTMRGLAQRIS